MPPVSPPQRWPRGPTNELHTAAIHGSTERTTALLSLGLIDIDQGAPTGMTPLILAAMNNNPRVVRVLLNKGANVSIASDDGLTPLLASAASGHLAVTKMLVKAGADLEAATCHGWTPLHMAGESGYSGVMRVLIEAGANVDSREPDGTTPLYRAAAEGHRGAITELLRAKANPLLARTEQAGYTTVPLEAAATCGHLEAARELIQELGVKACGGARAGVGALYQAAQYEHVDIMAMLTDAGVVDTGVALNAAATCCSEASVKFLLRQKKGKTTHGDAYLNKPSGRFVSPPLFSCISESASSAPRIARLLIDAGADTTLASPVRLTEKEGSRVIYNFTPLALTMEYLRRIDVGGKDAKGEQRHNTLEAIRRLLLQVEAVHAVSWLWSRHISAAGHAAEDTSRSTSPSTQLRLMLPIMKRRARRRGVLLAALLRYSSKP